MGCSCLSLNSFTLAWNKIKEHVVKELRMCGVLNIIKAGWLSCHYRELTSQHRVSSCENNIIPCVKGKVHSFLPSYAERSQYQVSFWTEALRWAETRTLQQGMQEDDWSCSLLSKQAFHTAKDRPHSVVSQRIMWACELSFRVINSLFFLKKKKKKN